MKISSFVEGRPQTDGEKSGEMKQPLAVLVGMGAGQAAATRQQWRGGEDAVGCSRT